MQQYANAAVGAVLGGLAGLILLVGLAVVAGPYRAVPVSPAAGALVGLVAGGVLGAVSRSER